MENESSLVPLMKEVERAEEDERREKDFVQLINQPVPKPWVSLRELKEDAPYPIISTRKHTNKHRRRVILKISNAGSKSVCEVYLPQRFASCISTEKIVEFNKNCKNLVMIVSHKSGNWTDIKIIRLRGIGLARAFLNSSAKPQTTVLPIAGLCSSVDRPAVAKVQYTDLEATEGGGAEREEEDEKD
ncbi:uncharacterized protein LOC120356604 [Nilaparvata lugens]|uniref:uncharacterized protein LOC120356604 n=1 Tax=Nilaparvata lugens TaxID=108931 RepID=UPI00193E3A42|nr:uncharacterized protein LOC120356604 [Nilaparvata lugens]